MKRDMDLIREILLKIEEHDVNSSSYDTIEIKEYTSREICEHVRLLESAGLIDGAHYDIAGNVWVQRITWSGYDYLDKVRDDSVWKKTKDVIKEKGLPLIFDTIKTIASALITATAEGVANSIINNGGHI